MMIYLDSNIYRDIIDRREKWQEIIKKILKLKRQGVKFPYSPAHIEEISNITKIPSYFQSLIDYNLRLLNRFSQGIELLPGFKPPEDIDSVIQMSKSYGYIISNEEMQILEEAKKHWNDASAFERFIRVNLSHPRESYTRVIRDKESSTLAENLNISEIGVRTENIASKNYKAIGQTYTGDPLTHNQIQQKFGIDTKTINEVPYDKIFDQNNIKELLTEIAHQKGEHINSLFMLKGTEALKYHYNLEKWSEILYDTLEKAGYWREKEDDHYGIISRMHDISHAIYASKTQYFVTKDDRFSKKTRAVYHMLEIATTIISKEFFLEQHLLVSCDSNRVLIMP